LLQRPDIIVLDEATSALDPKSQEALMQLLSDEMKSLTLIRRNRFRVARW